MESLKLNLLRNLRGSWLLVLVPSHLESDAALPSALWASHLLDSCCAAVVFKLLVFGLLYAPSNY